MNLISAYLLLGMLTWIATFALAGHGRVVWFPGIARWLAFWPLYVVRNIKSWER